MRICYALDLRLELEATEMLLNALQQNFFYLVKSPTNPTVQIRPIGQSIAMAILS